MPLQIPRTWRRRLAIALGVIGVIMLAVGLATGYIDVSLWGIFVGMIGEAIVLQERKRPG
jgi:hypothetical protein